MYVCDRVRNVCLSHTHTHTHTQTHTLHSVSHCLSSLPISTLTLSLAQVPSSAPQMSAFPSPGGPESPCWALSSRSCFLTHLIGLHLPHQPHLHVDTLLACPEGSDHLPWALWPPGTRCRPGSATLPDFGMELSRKGRAVEGKALILINLADLPFSVHFVI